MGVELLLGVMKIFYTLTEVMLAQHCEYIKSHELHIFQ
jgi:hypothetical protein